MADRRFETSFKQLPGSDEPGLVLGDDDVVYLIKPDGSRVELGAVFNGGTISTPLTVSPGNKDATSITIQPVAGATTDAALALNINDDAGNQIFFIDAQGDGGLNLPSAFGSFFSFTRDNTTMLEVGASGGGHVTISPAGRTTFGATTILMTSLPAADPHVVGQLYTSAGAVKVSAG